MDSNEKRLFEYIEGIKGLDETAMRTAREKLDSLAKPPGSLGRLEDIAVTLSGISGSLLTDISKRCVIIMASDNGVTEEGVASAPQSVTYAQTLNFTRGITGAAVLAQHFGTDLMIVDVGVNGDFNHPMIIDRKIRKSTNNIAKMPAMTRQEAVQAVLTGIEMAARAKAEGYKLLGAGEMGIGNTTTSSAVLSGLTELPAGLIVGRGAGLSDAAYLLKKEIITKAVRDLKPDKNDPLDVVAKVGGFDIAAMAGVYIGAAYERLPVVIDGFISAVAALVAYRLAPLVKGYMLASHSSHERGYTHAVREIGISHHLNLEMRLGEGSGCPIMFALMDAACAIMKDMGTFEESNIDKAYVGKIPDINF